MDERDPAQALPDRLRQGVCQAGADAEFHAASQGLDVTIRCRIDASPPVDIDCVLGGGRHTLVLDAPADVWLACMVRHPAPGFQSFLALARQPDRLRVQGDPLLQAQALHVLERLFEVLRGDVDEPASAAPDLAGMTGHYAGLQCGDAAVNVYYECSGAAQAPVLLMLHTAGADARQYHALMADRALQAQWRMIAFDMPAHGRSDPLPGQAWQGYRLDRQAYLDICLAFIRQVVAQPVVLLGCSMGAAMALHVAARSRMDALGVVALEAPWRASGRLTPYQAHAGVNGQSHNPAYVRGLMGPAASLDQRRRAAWIYSQGGFGIYAGDLWFYSQDFDAQRDLAGLRAAPDFIVSLLTGEYDYSATPHDSRRVADSIPGARFQSMAGIGHFPMTENPQLLLQYLRPELAMIRKTCP